jgi:mannose-6-phosphate isomerase-like protein (cupin superfamily)
LLVALTALPVFAGSKGSESIAPATYVSAAEIEAALKQAPPDASVYDKVIKTVDAGGYKVSIVILHRVPKPGSEDRGLKHEKVTEVYQIISGAGTLETGGTMTDTSPVDLTEQAAGPSVRGTIQGGETRHMGPGDVAVILPHVPHRFSKYDGTITYLVTRIELAAH